MSQDEQDRSTSRVNIDTAEMEFIASTPTECQANLDLTHAVVQSELTRGVRPGNFKPRSRFLRRAPRQ